MSDQQTPPAEQTPAALDTPKLLSYLGGALLVAVGTGGAAGFMFGDISDQNTALRIIFDLIVIAALGAAVYFWQSKNDGTATTTFAVFAAFVLANLISTFAPSWVTSLVLLLAAGGIYYMWRGALPLVAIFLAGLGLIQAWFASSVVGGSIDSIGTLSVTASLALTIYGVAWYIAGLRVPEPNTGLILAGLLGLVGSMFTAASNWFLGLLVILITIAGMAWAYKIRAHAVYLVLGILTVAASAPIELGSIGINGTVTTIILLVLGLLGFGGAFYLLQQSGQVSLGKGSAAPAAKAETEAEAGTEAEAPKGYTGPTGSSQEEQ